MSPKKYMWQNYVEGNPTSQGRVLFDNNYPCVSFVASRDAKMIELDEINTIRNGSMWITRCLWILPVTS